MNSIANSFKKPWILGLIGSATLTTIFLVAQPTANAANPKLFSIALLKQELPKSTRPNPISIAFLKCVPLISASPKLK